ncbi:hypothetical protein ACFX2G_035205 [Malus domestica]
MMLCSFEFTNGVFMIVLLLFLDLNGVFSKRRLEEEETDRSRLEEAAGHRGLLRFCRSQRGNEYATICFHDWENDGISKVMEDEETWRGVKAGKLMSLIIFFW